MNSAKPELSPTQISQFLASRRSTRDFLSNPIPRDLLNEVLEDAMTAPSWSNTRPFLVAIAEGGVKERISKEFLNRWANVSKNLRKGLLGKITLLFTRYGLPTSNRLVGKPYSKDLKPRSMRLGAELLGSMGISRDNKDARDKWWATNYQFYGAPTELFIYIHKSLGIFSASDAGLMMENLMLSAHARGLGTCAQGAVSIWDDVVRKEFDVPKNYRLLCGLAIGYPSDAPANSFKSHRIAANEITVSPRSTSA
jgi:nitroreductase